MENNSTAYIIFGASGDLAKRYLLPALANMNYEGIIVPISRKDYGNLKKLIPSDGNKIFHLAIPPKGVTEAVRLISENFGKANNIKIMLEKPFGQDLKSAQDLVEHVDQYFNEDQIYRIDHYLAKKSVQEITRTDWNKSNVQSIEIIASEKIGIEGRVNFYEQTGALRDFVQSHLLELVAIILMKEGEESVAERRHTALQNLEVVCDITLHECVKRGQYEGYREEVGNPKSLTETFVSINMISNDPLWRGIPITMATGKALQEKFTHIKIKYKNGGIKIFNIEHEPDAYEHVIEAALEDKHNLFISSGEVLESWRILDAVQESWKHSKDDLIIYKKNSSINDI
ncbi:MAG TPA: hypothetical protein VJC14_02480 [Candidatus Paceibacterota bacterium]